jgi:integrase
MARGVYRGADNRLGSIAAEAVRSGSRLDWLESRQNFNSFGTVAHAGHPLQKRRSTMPKDESITTQLTPTPWNKGKLVGAKPRLRAKHVWSIRTKLQVEGRMRDLAMFNLAIDSKLRGCDAVSLRVEDVAPHGQAVDRATVRQKKTGQPFRFELTEQTREAVDAYLKAAGKKPGEFLFARCRGFDSAITPRQYARLVSKWVSSIGLNPSFFGTHSLRRKVTLIYRRTGNLRAVQLLFRRRS